MTAPSDVAGMLERAWSRPWPGERVAQLCAHVAASHDATRASKFGTGQVLSCRTRTACAELLAVSAAVVVRLRGRCPTHRLLPEEWAEDFWCRRARHLRGDTEATLVYFETFLRLTEDMGGGG